MRRRMLPWLVLLALLAPARSGAEIPALTREFVTADFTRTPEALAALAHRHHVAGAFAGGAYWAGREPGSANAFRSGNPLGGRAEALLRAGRWTAGGDATNDGALDAEPGEYAQRVFAAADVPEWRFALTAAAGFGRGRHRGEDVAAELAPLHWNLHLATMDLAPRAWGWLRVRRPAGGGPVTWTPAAALALQHFVVLGSQPVVAFSLRSDMADARLPVTSGMLQLGFASVPKPLGGGRGTGGDPDMPGPAGGPAPSLVDRNWFATLGWAFPFDDRSSGRFAVQAGMRFVRPWGGS